ncbi:protein kinase domain-containing protein [Subtercola sp. RTI3]|uniref:protein kinase domain-containing protein n=1 Tax=Subtercola sp. RTI3 TaxID=3048639 RepID=UPI002B225605|nr:PASTA domain-containing protein [Subtercola sp. RTI3]MEA9986492.1 PASTA domain-containing protein [Subtercola sp. RTI3]
MDARPPGLVSARFALGDLLGSGGSASVFEAVDVLTDERVALKILHPHLSHSPASREAFFVEARAAEPLRHPNIAGVLGVGVHDPDGEPLAWIALERAPGTTLAEYIESNGVLGVGEALALADGMLRALSAAHAIGLVHRDVSPANVMVSGAGGVAAGAGGGTAGEGADVGVGVGAGADYGDAAGVGYGVAGAAARARARGADGRVALMAEGVRLVDFGLADAAGRPALGADVLRSAVSDRSLGVLGSVNYMSPEQATGSPVDAPGDLYQVGAVLFFALTGQPPFVRDHAQAVMRAHLTAPPPVASVLRPGLPRAVDRMLAKALLKDPAARFASAEAMRAEVLRIAAVLPGAPGTMLTAVATAVATPVANSVDGVTGAKDGFNDVALAGASAAMPAGSSTGLASLRGTVGPRRRSGGAVWLTLILMATAVGVVWMLAANGSPRGTAAALPPAASATGSPAGSADAPGATTVTPPATPQPSALPLPTAAASPVVAAAAMVPVPEVAGITLAEAQRQIEAAGLRLGTVTPVNSALPNDTVLEASPVTGGQAAHGSAVDLTVASGSNSVPRVVGLTQGDAVPVVQRAGFAVVVAARASGSVPVGTVLAVEPGEGSELRLATSVTLVVATAPTAPAPTPATTVPTTPPTASGAPRP